VWRGGDSLLYVDVGCKSLAGHVLLNGFKEVKVTGREIGTVGSMSITSQPQCRNYSQVRLAVWGPVVSICLGSLRSTWLASDLQQTLTWSKLSLPGCIHPFLLHRNTSLGATVGQMLKFQWWRRGGLMQSALFWDITHRWVVVLYRRFGTAYRSHILTMYVWYIEVRIKISASEYPLVYCWNSFVHPMRCLQNASGERKIGRGLWPLNCAIPEPLWFLFVGGWGRS
jgi:hypothetical protein